MQDDNNVINSLEEPTSSTRYSVQLKEENSFALSAFLALSSDHGTVSESMSQERKRFARVFA
jgi:hypothetical protein